MDCSKRTVCVTLGVYMINFPVSTRIALCGVSQSKVVMSKCYYSGEKHKELIGEKCDGIQTNPTPYYSFVIFNRDLRLPTTPKGSETRS